MNSAVSSASIPRVIDDDSASGPEELDSLTWADSLTVELGGLRYELRSTSAAFVRAAARRLRVPMVHGRPDVVLSAVVPSGAPTETSVLSLYEGSQRVVRTLSPETLMRAFLDDLRGRVLISASDRVFLKVRIISSNGIGVLMPSLESNDVVRIERAAAKVGITVASAGALALDLRYGRPVSQFRPPSKDRSPSTGSIDAIATQAYRGGLPSKEDVLAELARQTLNLHSVGARGIHALRALVERTALIEWDNRQPFKALEPLFVAAPPVAARKLPTG
ncbi:MAG: hypothetical protein ACRDJL_09460 [Actinomycetota bacterium]